jgi:excisionase family DNA binding protein
MAQYSISEAARLLGVHRATLHRWIEGKVVPEPATQQIAGSRIRYPDAARFRRARDSSCSRQRLLRRKLLGPVHSERLRVAAALVDLG